MQFCINEILHKLYKFAFILQIKYWNENDTEREDNECFEELTPQELLADHSEGTFQFM